MKKSISIIVPVYNNQKTIERCVESIIGQTESNWNLILINDGSTDNSLEICEKYEKKDNRIKVINQKNNGVSSARNRGLEVADGDYIIFVDSDDYVELNLIETLNNIIEKEKKIELIIFGSYQIRENKKTKIYAKNARILSNLDIIKAMSDRNIFDFFVAPHGKIFKTENIKDNNLRFDKNIDLGEDTCFVLDYVKNINNCIIIDNCLYDNVIIDGSLSRRDRKDIFGITEKIQEKYNEIISGKNIDKKLSNNILMRNLMISVNVPVNFNWKSIERKKIYDQIRDYDEFKRLKVKEINIKYYKLVYILLKYKMDILLKYLIKIKNIIRKITR